MDLRETLFFGAVTSSLEFTRGATSESFLLFLCRPRFHRLAIVSRKSGQ